MMSLGKQVAILSCQRRARASMLIPGAAVASTTHAAKPISIGVIQITLTHGYQLILNSGYKAEAKKLGVNMQLCINNLDPSKNVSCAEDLLYQGSMCLSTRLRTRLASPPRSSWPPPRRSVVNDGSPEPIQPNAVPFTGSDSIGGGREAGQFASGLDQGKPRWQAQVAN